MPSNANLLVTSTSEQQQQRKVGCLKHNNLTNSSILYEDIYQLLDILNLTMMQIEKTIFGVR